MKYFQVEVDEQYQAPNLQGWFGVIDKKTLDRTGPHQVGRHLLFSVESNIQMVFTDVVTTPCFMVSETVRNVIRKYESRIFFNRIIVLDKENRQSMAYYIPSLDSVSCTFRKEQEHGGEWRAEVERKSVEGKAIAEITDGYYFRVIMRMDLVESILRRQTVGIGLQELQMI